MTSAPEHPAARAAREAREHAQRYRAIFDPDNGMSAELESLASHIEALLKEREELRAALKWIADGEQNTAAFRARAALEQGGEG